MTDHSLDMPYEPTGGSVPWIGDDLNVTGGVVVLASTVPVGDETWPALIFRFPLPDGSRNFYPPIIMVCSDDHMAKLRPILIAAMHDAREAARAAS